MTTEAEKPTHYFNTDLIPIAPGFGLLGAATNGAMPQPALGFWVESEIHIAENNRDVVENYWLRIAVEPDNGPQTGRGDYLVYSNEFARLEKLLSAIVNATVRGISAGKLSDSYDSYHNSAQTAHDENLSDECIEDLSCSVSARPDGGFELTFDGETKKHNIRAAVGIVSRLTGRLDPAASALLLSEFDKFRETRRDACFSLYKAIEAMPAPEESASPAP